MKQTANTQTVITHKTVIIDGYRITQEYSHILIGVNCMGKEKCFRYCDQFFTQSQLDAIESYWLKQEREFGGGRLEIEYGF